MPLYMDRHDVSPVVTAENVAALHREDLKIQHLYNCRGLTYWFDEQRATAFCLVEAPDAGCIREMHMKAHGEVPNQIIEVEAGIVESFLGRIEDPAKAKNAELNIINDPAFRIVMAIRVQGNERPVNGNGAVNGVRQTVKKMVDDMDGSLVSSDGDHYLISFKSAGRAIQCAYKIHDAIKNLPQETENRNLSVNIGLSAGVPVTNKEQFFQEAVKLANCFCMVANNRIGVSGEVKNLYASEISGDLLQSGRVFFCFHPGDETLFLQLMNFMEESYHNSLTVSDFRKALGLSTSNLYRKITLLTGTSLIRFIRDYRLDVALDLLKKEIYSLSEIAYHTGFTSLSYFSKCFQKKYGQSPSSFTRSL